MKPLCVTQINAALYQTGAATKQAATAIVEFSAAVFQGSKYLHKSDRRRIGRMIRRGKIVRNGKVTFQ